MVGWQMNSERETIWKEAVVARWKHYPGICKELVTIAGVPVGIRKQYHQNASPKHYLLTDIVLNLNKKCYQFAASKYSTAIPSSTSFILSNWLRNFFRKLWLFCLQGTSIKEKKINVKLSLWQALEAHRVVRRRGSHIFSRQSTHGWRWGCQPYAPAALYSQGRFLVLLSLRAWVDSRAMVRLEELGLLKNSVTTSGIEPVTFRLVV
jgi:hypothetical protein